MCCDPPPVKIRVPDISWPNQILSNGNMKSGMDS